jgi:hypothetical protein
LHDCSEKSHRQRQQTILKNEQKTRITLLFRLATKTSTNQNLIFFFAFARFQFVGINFDLQRFLSDLNNIDTKTK